MYSIFDIKQCYPVAKHLVVAGNSNVDITQRRVSVAQCYHWDVDVRSLRNRLMILTRVGYDQQTRLTECCLQQQ